MESERETRRFPGNCLGCLKLAWWASRIRKTSLVPSYLDQPVASLDRCPTDIHY